MSDEKTTPEKTTPQSLTEEEASQVVGGNQFQEDWATQAKQQYDAQQNSGGS